MNRPAWFVGSIGVVGLVASAVYLLRDAQPEFQGAVLVFVGSVGAAIFTHWMAKRREIEARHFEQKRAAYETLTDLWFKQIVAQKTEGGKFASLICAPACCRSKRSCWCGETWK